MKVEVGSREAKTEEGVVGIDIKSKPELSVLQKINYWNKTPTGQEVAPAWFVPGALLLSSCIVIPGTGDAMREGEYGNDPGIGGNGLQLDNVYTCSCYLPKPHSNGGTKLFEQLVI